MDSIVFFLPCFYEPYDKRSTGGTISNYLLVKELSFLYSVTVIAAEASDECNLNVNLISGPSIIGDVYHNSTSARVRKILRFFWMKNQYKKISFEDYKYIFLTNGTLFSGYKKTQKNKLVILTRAFEDFYKNKIDDSCFLKGYFYKKCDCIANDAYNKAKLIITNSDFMRDKITAYFGVEKSKVDILYPPIKLPNDIQFSCDKKRFNICIINPSHLKGESVFLRLADKMPEHSFCYFAKSDKYYEQSNIKYMGWGSNAKKMFSEFDLLLVPSLWEEPFGRVAAEGLLYGKPVLVSNRGGLPEIVTEYFLVENDDVELWKNKILDIYNNSDVYSEWAKAVNKAKFFSSEMHDKKVKNILNLN